MIIDFRMRPPVGEYIGSAYGNPENIRKATARVGFNAPPSVLEKSPGLLREEMRAAGISHAVIPARVAAKGSVSNEFVASTVDASDGMFYGLAAFNPQSMQTALEELEQYVVNGPLTGVGFEPGMLPEPMHADDKRLYPLYDACQEKGIFVSIMTAAACGPDISFTLPALLDKVARDFPKLVIVNAHAGWPWVTQSVYLAQRHPNIFLCPDFVVFNMPGMQDLVLAANYYLQDRFLFATGYPHIGHAEAIEFYKKHIRQEVQDKIFYKNAARLLNISTK